MKPVSAPGVKPSWPKPQSGERAPLTKTPSATPTTTTPTPTTATTPTATASNATASNPSIAALTENRSPPTSQAALTITSSEAPTWATPKYFADVAKKASGPAPQSTPQAGNALTVRLQRPLGASKAVDVEQQRATGRSLLQRVAHQAGVLGGHPLSADDIEKLGTTIHLTREVSVQPILETGLRPTTNPLANWSTWCRHAVYMFPAPPKDGSLEDKIVRRQGMTEIMEVDLKKLDPDKLYRRIMDGAIIYLSATPIPTEAITHRGTLPSATKQASS